MKALLKYIAENIVEKPEEIEITQEKTDDYVNLRLKVNPDDLKFVIGKKGKIIRSIRNLLRLKAMISKSRVNLQLKED